MNKNKDYLITEKPSRALFAFALPMIIGNLFQQTYTIVDSAIVGHYVGETALAAVGASYALRVLIAKFGAPVYGIAMVWYAVPLGWLANFLISYGYYRTGKWKQLK